MLPFNLVSMCFLPVVSLLIGGTLGIPPLFRCALKLLTKLLSGRRCAAVPPLDAAKRNFVVELRGRMAAGAMTSPRWDAVAPLGRRRTWPALRLALSLFSAFATDPTSSPSVLTAAISEAAVAPCPNLVTTDRAPAEAW